MSVSTLPIANIARILSEDAICNEKRKQIAHVLGVPTESYNEWDGAIRFRTKSKVEYFKLCLEHWIQLRAGRATQGELLAILRTKDIQATHAVDQIKGGSSTILNVSSVALPTRVAPQPEPERINVPTISCSVSCESDSEVFYMMSCGHVVCSECSPMIQSCPICRGNHEPKIRLYL